VLLLSGDNVISIGDLSMSLKSVLVALPLDARVVESAMRAVEGCIRIGGVTALSALIPTKIVGLLINSVEAARRVADQMELASAGVCRAYICISVCVAVCVAVCVTVCVAVCVAVCEAASLPVSPCVSPYVTVVPHLFSFSCSLSLTVQLLVCTVRAMRCYDLLCCRVQGSRRT
jgi:hypothetical protein